MGMTPRRPRAEAFFVGASFRHSCAADTFGSCFTPAPKGTIQVRAACLLGNILRRKQCVMIWVAARAVSAALLLRPLQPSSSLHFCSCGRHGADRGWPTTRLPAPPWVRRRVRRHRHRRLRPRLLHPPRQNKAEESRQGLASVAASGIRNHFQFRCMVTTPSVFRSATP
jgi:hypothetical protein